MEFSHKSVMLNETIEGLSIKPNGIYLDGTLGGAGHSYEIAKQLTDGGHLYGVDQDADAITAATERLAPYADRVTIIRNNYRNAVEELKRLGVTGVDGILLDLGVSSYKLTTVKALQAMGFETIAAGDSYNDLGMILNSKAGFLFKSTDKIKADYPELPAFEEYDEFLEAIKKAL